MCGLPFSAFLLSTSSNTPIAQEGTSLFYRHISLLHSLSIFFFHSSLFLLPSFSFSPAMSLTRFLSAAFIVLACKFYLHCSGNLFPLSIFSKGYEAPVNLFSSECWRNEQQQNLQDPGTTSCLFLRIPKERKRDSTFIFLALLFTLFLRSFWALALSFLNYISITSAIFNAPSSSLFLVLEWLTHSYLPILIFILDIKPNLISLYIYFLFIYIHRHLLILWGISNTFLFSTFIKWFS